MNQEQTWLAFQQMMAQQQQNMMLQNQFQLYLQFCQKNGLVFGDPNSFNLFFQKFSQEQAFLQPRINHQPQVPNNQNMNIGNSNNLQELMPSSEQTNKINIAFKADNGLNLIINVDKNVTIFDLFTQYMDKIRLSYKYLGTRIQFFYDGAKVDPFSYAPVYSKFKNNQSIAVYDEDHVLIG